VASSRPPGSGIGSSKERRHPASVLLSASADPRPRHSHCSRGKACPHHRTGRHARLPKVYPGCFHEPSRNPRRISISWPSGLTTTFATNQSLRLISAMPRGPEGDGEARRVFVPVARRVALRQFCRKVLPTLLFECLSRHARLPAFGRHLLNSGPRRFPSICSNDCRRHPLPHGPRYQAAPQFLRAPCRSPAPNAVRWVAVHPPPAPQPAETAPGSPPAGAVRLSYRDKIFAESLRAFDYHGLSSSDDPVARCRRRIRIIVVQCPQHGDVRHHDNAALLGGRDRAFHGNFAMLALGFRRW
jgi:hypothetical protein